jgi:hypothetical protein
MGFLCNRNWVTRRSGQPDFSNGSKWPQFSIRPLDRTSSFAKFPEAVFLGVNMESQLGDVEVVSARLQ